MLSGSKSLHDLWSGELISTSTEFFVKNSTVPQHGKFRQKSSKGFTLLHAHNFMHLKHSAKFQRFGLKAVGAHQQGIALASPVTGESYLVIISVKCRRIFQMSNFSHLQTKYLGGNNMRQRFFFIVNIALKKKTKFFISPTVENKYTYIKSMKTRTVSNFLCPKDENSGKTQQTGTSFVDLTNYQFSCVSNKPFLSFDDKVHNGQHQNF